MLLGFAFRTSDIFCGFWRAHSVRVPCEICQYRKTIPLILYLRNQQTCQLQMHCLCALRESALPAHFPYYAGRAGEKEHLRGYEEKQRTGGHLHKVRTNRRAVDSRILIGYVPEFGAVRADEWL